jgi:chromate transporter
VILSLWWGWLRVGFLGFGGGPSVVPLIREECVRGGWASDTEFLDMLALGNALPGPIAVKLAVAVGLKAAGWLGAGVALAGLCLPGVSLMVVLAAVFDRFKEHPGVAGMMRGARAAVVGMLAWTVWELAGAGVRDLWTGMVAGVALGLLVGGVHPGWVIVGAVGVGWWFR